MEFSAVPTVCYNTRSGGRAVIHGEVLITSIDAAHQVKANRSLPAWGVLDRKRTGYRTDGLVQFLGVTSVNHVVLEASREFDLTGSKFFSIHKR